MDQRDYSSHGIQCGALPLLHYKAWVSKRTSLSQFANIRNNGLIALSLREDDELMGVRLTDGTKQIIIGTKNGLLIRFPETDVREMGRTAAGVKGITLTDDDVVVGMEILEEESHVLIVTEKGTENELLLKSTEPKAGRKRTQNSENHREQRPTSSSESY